MMAFSDEERDKVLEYLGYQFSDQTMRLVRQNCDRVTALSFTVEKRLQSYLRELERINGEINEARPFASRTFQTTQGGTSQMNPYLRLSTLRDEGRRYVRLLASGLGLAIASDYFASGEGEGGTVRYVRG